MAHASTPKGERSRARILAGAIDVAYEQGLDAVTFRRVADAANVKPALVAYYFDSSEKLVASAIETATRNEIATVRRQLDKARNLRDDAALTELLVDVLLGPQQQRRTADESRILVRYERLIATRRWPELRAIMELMHDEHINLVIEVLEALGLRSDRQSAYDVIAYVDGSVVGNLMQPRRPSREVAREAVLRYEQRTRLDLAPSETLSTD